MGHESYSSWCVIGCVLGVSWLYLGHVSANMSFPPGLGPGIHRNSSLKDKMYLQILKARIQREIDKYRNTTLDDLGAGMGESEEKEEEEEEMRGQSDKYPRYRPQFVHSSSQGRNLLSFTIKRPSDMNGQGERTQVTRVNLWIHVWQKEKKRPRQTRRRRKGKMIRISVFNNSERDTDAIAELRTRIHVTSWFRISLPVSIVQNLQPSNNNTIVLRVECKRCNRRTKIMLPQKPSKANCKKNKRKRKRKGRNKKMSKRKPKSRQKLRALRKSRKRCGSARLSPQSPSSKRLPFMVIENRYSGSGNSRRKRSVTCSPSNLRATNTTTVVRRRRSERCCRMTSYVDFSEMNLEDSIVTPGGYQASRCVGRCPRLRRGRNRRNRRRNRNRNKRSNERKKRGKCRAVQTSPLRVWLFNSEHNLVEVQLADLVVNSCDCR